MTTITQSPTLNPSDNVCYTAYVNATSSVNPIQNAVYKYGVCLEKVYSKVPISTTDEKKCGDDLAIDLSNIKNDPVLNTAKDAFIACVIKNNTPTSAPTTKPPTPAPTSATTTVPTSAMTTKPYVPTTGPENGFPTYAIVIIVIALLLLGSAAFYMNRDKIMMYFKSMKKNAVVAPQTLPTPYKAPLPKSSKKSLGLKNRK